MKRIAGMHFSFTRIIYVFVLMSAAFVATALNPLLAQDSTKDFKFKLGITYKVSTDKANAPQTINMWFSDNSYTGVEPGNNAMFLILNTQTQKVITVMESQKMAMTMNMHNLQQRVPQAQGDVNKELAKTTFTKTGVTENILGYNCTQYKITNDKNEALLWVTTELGAGFEDMFKNMMTALNKGKGGQDMAMPDTQGALNGVMMKVVATDLSTNKVTTLQATAVNKDGKEVNLNGYNMMNMPGQ